MSVKSDTNYTDKNHFHHTSVTNHKTRFTAPQSLTTNKTPTKANTKPGVKYSYTNEQLKEIHRHKTPNKSYKPTFWYIKNNSGTKIKQQNQENQKQEKQEHSTWNRHMKP